MLKEYKNAMLLFVGKLSEDVSDTFHQIVASSGVGDQILVTGYMEPNQFCDYIGATDVCLNLRYPYYGENSGSLAQILSRGKCVINDIGSFSEIPDDCCVKLPSVKEMQPGQEEEMIYSTMRQLMEDRGLRNKISQNARKYAETMLDIRIDTEQYTAFIKEAITNELNEKVVAMIQRDEISHTGYIDDEIKKYPKHWRIALCNRYNLLLAVISKDKKPIGIYSWQSEAKSRGAEHVF